MRPGLLRHRKFARLARLVGSRPLALGHLEMLWEVAYESGDDLLGDAGDVEQLAEWGGEAGRLASALAEAGFIDPVEGGGFRVHDLWDHAPEYVRKRRKREEERRETGARLRTPSGQCPPNGSQCLPNGKTPSPSPSPSPTTPRSARLGVGHPAFEAVEHWTRVWASISPSPCLPVTTRQAQALGALCGRLTTAEVMARMDRAAADPFWREKLTLDALLDNPDRFAARVGRDVPRPAEALEPDPDPGCPEWGTAREKVRGQIRPNLWRWFRPLRGRVAGGELVLVAPDAFHANFTRDTYGSFLTEQAGMPVRLEAGPGGCS